MEKALFMESSGSNINYKPFYQKTLKVSKHLAEKDTPRLHIEWKIGDNDYCLNVYGENNIREFVQKINEAANTDLYEI